MKLSFEHKNETIEFEIFFSQRKTLGIEIRPPGVVKVTAPLGCSEGQILASVSAKGNWIAEKRKQLKALEEDNKFSECYEAGSNFTFLGKNYKLAVVENGFYDIPKVELQGDHLQVSSASTHEILIKNAVEKWRDQMLKQHLINRVQHFQPFFEIAPSRIIVKDQKRRWGSCNSKRELRFNRACVKVSAKALDYLVVHEMSHLIHMDHSKAFWAQVEKVMPDYKPARAELKRTLI